MIMALFEVSCISLDRRIVAVFSKMKILETTISSLFIESPKDCAKNAYWII
jgi:hypothetical protein